MTTICGGLIIIAVIFGLYTIWACCKVASDADRHIEILEEERKDKKEKSWRKL